MASATTELPGGWRKAVCRAPLIWGDDFGLQEPYSFPEDSAERTPTINEVPESRTEYRVLLIYPDGSSRLWDVFLVKDKMDTKLRAIARRPGVRYHCEEWTAQAIAESRPVLLAEYDV